jgi:hypothetical protein
MDGKLVPLMTLLTVALVVWIGRTVFKAWQAKRAVAWNVVNAAMTLRAMTPEQAREFERTATELLPVFNMNQAALDRASPAVRFALYSMVMHRLGTAPFDSARPFSALASPHLARPAAKHIRAARILAEGEHGLGLTEFDEPAVAIAVQAQSPGGPAGR